MIIVIKISKLIGMTQKEITFANYYLATFNATEAAKLAGYSDHTARQQGSRLLSNVNIEKYIQERSETILDRLGVTQERVLLELSRIAFANLTDLFEDDWKLRNLSDIPKETSAGIKNLTKTETGVKVEMYDKLGALLKLWELLKDKAK
ncbi:MAG TPA: terminase small subunit [Algoriphagus sp.]|nr:terminase small subunit [Algoriphagus sp.]MAN87855.1 terminase small subunit [Algoriphagus sp.]HAD52324.1 terminase small subunit [Algoriphagus sp.]HAS58385.1 terminase small subunit [Algoriphagus sp.]HAZ24718.1 terminase small subunit [Algoriphagus sp.]